MFPFLTAAQYKRQCDRVTCSNTAFRRFIQDLMELALAVSTAVSSGADSSEQFNHVSYLYLFACLIQLRSLEGNASLKGGPDSPLSCVCVILKKCSRKIP